MEPEREIRTKVLFPLKTMLDITKLYIYYKVVLHCY